MERSHGEEGIENAGKTKVMICGILDRVQASTHVLSVVQE